MNDGFTVREARAAFGRLIDEVDAGKEVIITRRGKPVAKLVPYQSVSRKVQSFPDLAAFRASIRIEGEPLSDALQKMRDEERY